MPGGGMGGTQMDPELMRATMDALRTIAEVPAEISLLLREETVTFATDAAYVLVLELGADEVEVLQGNATLFGSARWKKEGLEIEREAEMGAGVKDKISVDEAGRLIIEREIDLMARGVDGTLVYARKNQ